MISYQREILYKPFVDVDILGVSLEQSDEFEGIAVSVCDTTPDSFKSAFEAAVVVDEFATADRSTFPTPATTLVLCFPFSYQLCK